MTDRKKSSPKAEKPEIDMYDMEIPEMEMPEISGMCPMMHSYPMMCPMMCPMMPGPMLHMPGEDEHRMGLEYMRSPDWYDEDDSDYSSEESDEYPGHWKQKKKYKYPNYPVFWPYFYPAKPYKKKHKKW